MQVSPFGRTRQARLESLLRRAGEALEKARILVEETEGLMKPRSTRHSRELAKRLSKLEAGVAEARAALERRQGS
jgi:hypothetical protein